MSELHTSEEICEALIRHVEMSSSEVFEKDFVKDGKVICTVWCMIGDNTQEFRDSCIKWLTDNGFKED
jgi:hypothetical protein